MSKPIKHKIRRVGQLVSQVTPSTRVYKITIDNENFYKELHKSRLINMLLNLYYEKTLTDDNEELQEILEEVKEIAESDHAHDWVFVDKGNHVSGSGLLFRYVCDKCGNYKRIDEDVLHQGMNAIIDNAENSEPTKLIPDDDGEQSDSEGYSPASIYD